MWHVCLCTYVKPLAGLLLQALRISNCASRMCSRRTSRMTAESSLERSALRFCRLAARSFFSSEACGTQHA